MYSVRHFSCYFICNYFVAEDYFRASINGFCFRIQKKYELYNKCRRLKSMQESLDFLPVTELEIGILHQDVKCTGVLEFHAEFVVIYHLKKACMFWI